MNRNLPASTNHIVDGRRLYELHVDDSIFHFNLKNGLTARIYDSEMNHIEDTALIISMDDQSDITRLRNFIRKNVITRSKSNT